jgi:hypothetical protein
MQGMKWIYSPTKVIRLVIIKLVHELVNLPMLPYWTAFAIFFSAHCYFLGSAVSVGVFSIRYIGSMIIRMLCYVYHQRCRPDNCLLIYPNFLSTRSHLHTSKEQLQLCRRPHHQSHKYFSSASPPMHNRIRRNLQPPILHHNRQYEFRHLSLMPFPTRCYIPLNRSPLLNHSLLILFS